MSKLVANGVNVGVSLGNAGVERSASHGRDSIIGDTNWYTITAFRDLAVNVIGSIVKGQRILVTGRLRVRDWSTDDKSGTNVEVEAETLGHDLRWGDAQFTRHNHTAADVPAEPAEVAAQV